MKKLLLALIFTVVGFSSFAEISQSDYDTVVKEKEFAESMKEHYKIMALYAQEEKALALIDVENYREYTDNLYTNLDESRNTIESLKELVVEANTLRASNESHFTQLLAGYEAQLYERVLNAQADAITIEELEAENLALRNQITYMLYSLLAGIIICLVWYIIRGVSTRELKVKKTPKSTPIAEPLTVVPKDPKPSKTSVKPEVEAEPVHTAEENIYENFSPFAYVRAYKKVIKNKATLDRKIAKSKEFKKGDQIEVVDEIKENNKGLAMGSLGATMKAIFTGWAYPKTTEPVETEEEKVIREKAEAKKAKLERAEANRKAREKAKADKKAKELKSGKRKSSTKSKAKK